MGSNQKQLKAPFPYFGGKSRVAALVWSRLGDVRNYVEPFAGSLAMLLNRPHEPQIETVNDITSFIANFWRAMKFDPQAVARFADDPVNECDLHSRHAWLVRSRKARAELARVRRDPHYFNAKIAGWWCWGACMWIGSGWCDERQQIPHMDGRYQPSSSAVVAAELHQKRPNFPDGSAGSRGVISSQIPELTGSGGIHGNYALTNCELRRRWLIDWFQRLRDRLRPVRVCCGHWNRVCDSESTLTRLGTTGVFLDPPYRKRLACGKQNRAPHIYANDKSQDVDKLVDEVQAWCLKWGDNRDIRIAVCGLEGEYAELDAAGWDKVAWKSLGGYGNRNKNNDNAERERIWFSRYCLSGTEHKQAELFE